VPLFTSGGLGLGLKSLILFTSLTIILIFFLNKFILTQRETLGKREQGSIALDEQRWTHSHVLLLRDSGPATAAEATISSQSVKWSLSDWQEFVVNAVRRRSPYITRALRIIYRNVHSLDEAQTRRSRHQTNHQTVTVHMIIERGE